MEPTPTMSRPQPALSLVRAAGIGCGAVLLLLIVVAVAIVSLTYRHYARDLEVQSEVERRHGARDAYKAPADGSIAADRVARFLAVREALMPRCESITEVAEAFTGVADEAQGRQPSAAALFGRIAGAVRHVPTMGLVFGEYVTDRNRGLLEREMGLGEYAWIYVTAYFAYLGQRPQRVLEDEDRPSLYESRVFPEAAEVIARHVATARMTAGPWVDEQARLRRDRERIPFEDGLPPELAASYEPFRDQFARAACPAAAELDLTITVQRAAFGYDHR